jgi:uncharacterized protein YjiS (DUF1127 family)
MIRLTELHGDHAGSAAARWDQRSVDVLSVVQTARTLRAEFIADHTHRGLEAFGRWSGLTALFSSLRRRLRHRRTLTALGRLDDRLLSDIGVSRAEIEATAAFCCETQPQRGESVWQKIGAWLSREHRRRQTIRELSAMSDEMLADVGIARADIPAIAAALFVERPAAAAPVGEPVERGSEIPVTAQVLSFIEVRRSLHQAAQQNAERPAA